MKTRLGLLLAAICLFAASAAAQTLDVVHRFQSDGGAYGRLIQAIGRELLRHDELGRDERRRDHLQDGLPRAP